MHHHLKNVLAKRLFHYPQIYLTLCGPLSYFSHVIRWSKVNIQGDIFKSKHFQVRLFNFANRLKKVTLN